MIPPPIVNYHFQEWAYAVIKYITTWQLFISGALK